MSSLLSFQVFLLIIVKINSQQDSPIKIANNDFALRLLKTSSIQSQPNIFLSPLSISVALAMLYAGAAGTTAKELESTLGYQSSGISGPRAHREWKSVLNSIGGSRKSEQYQLLMASRILSQNSHEILPKFNETLVRDYQAIIDKVDFSGNSSGIVQNINNWVCEKTKGKIKSIVEELNPATCMVLLNAIYFKGIWLKTFNSEKTEERKFYNGGISVAKVQTMIHKRKKFQFAELKNLNAKYLLLPYKGNEVAMELILPNNKTGLKSLTNNLKSWHQIDSLTRELKPRNVDVFLPKWKLERSYNLVDSLSKLGAAGIFESRANFSLISRNKGLFVSDVIHKASIEVNEQGSEAAAATAVIMTRSSSFRRQIPVFKADHPFLYLIRDKTGLILFAGTVDRLS